MRAIRRATRKTGFVVLALAVVTVGGCSGNGAQAGSGGSATGGTPPGTGGVGGPGTGGKPATGGASADGGSSGGAASGGAVGGGATGGASASGGAPTGSGGAGVAGRGSAGANASGGIGGAGGNASGGGGRAGSSGGAGGASAPPWCLPLSAHPMGLDWAKALIDSRMRANVTLTWQYPDGLFLHGVYLAYKRLNSAPYLAYIKKWADANVAGGAPYNSLDSMQPTIVLDDMYRETMDAKYGTAPMAVAKRLETDYPKTSDGGFWHKTDTTNQLWGDGVFMDLPAYVSAARLFTDDKAIDIATNQLIIYDKHIAAPNNLHVHQWDGSAMKQSCCEWCRAEGWYEMSILMVLDETPATHANYAALVAIVQRLAMGLKATQDPATGRWWQVMDKPNDSANWLETSCTAMHTYFLSKASQKGYIDAATYAPLAIKGFMGEMQMVSSPDDVQVKNICPGTGVLATAADYYARPKATNDQHGVGAFLLMYDQLVCR